MGDHHFKLNLPTSSGSDGQLVLDGVDVSGAVRSVELRAGVGEFNVITLHLAMRGAEVDGIAQLHLAAAQVGLLARFGWRPPVGYRMNERGDVLLERPTDPADPRGNTPAVPAGESTPEVTE